MRLRQIAVAAFAIASTACSAPRPPWADGAFVTERRTSTAPQNLANLESRVLGAHNAERARVGVAPLAWDPALAAAAAAYGAQLAAQGRLQHSPVASRPGQGENLWLGTRGAYSLEEMVGAWVGERRYFRPGVFPDVSSTGQWSDVGHYTNLIWPDTTRVGCALRSSGGDDVLACRYAPAGNVIGQRVP